MTARPVVSVVLAAATAGAGLLYGQPGDRSEAVRQAIQSGTARSVILFIGDGMGDAEITLARNYAGGAAGRLAVDTLPLTGAVTTYSVEEGDPSIPNYVADSAATGTAWATGSKTSNGRISTTARTDLDLKTILELANEHGLRTGSVTTAEITDATPAVLAAHVASRACHGPADMGECPQDRKGAGGPGSIAEQLIDHTVDVLFGGGAARFAQTTDQGTGTVLDRAASLGYSVVRTEAEMASLAPGSRALGLFASGNLVTEWTGLEALPYPSNTARPQRSQTGMRPGEQPALEAMTAKAIELLERSPDGKGFFLQVEGALIDKQSHLANPCAQVGETVAFDRAVGVGVEYARSHPDTLLVVTADHGHAAQIVGAQTDLDHATGLISALRTNEGAVLTVSYGTTPYHRSQDHTGTQVRVGALGPHAWRVLGVIDQTDLFRIMYAALGLTPQPKNGR